MVQRGTLKNGVIVPDEPATLPDGTRMKFVPVEDPGQPPTGETREEFLAGLRDDIAAIKAGTQRGVPLHEAMARIRSDLGLPPHNEG